MATGKKSSENREAKYSFLQIDEETKLNVFRFGAIYCLKENLVMNLTTESFHADSDYRFC